MTSRTLLLLAALIGGTAAAGTKVIKNDNFTGAGGIFAGVSFGEYEGAGVMFEGQAGDYPMKIIGVDILAVSYLQQGTGLASYVIDLYDEAGSAPPPKPDDAGGWPLFALTPARLAQDGVQLTTSSTQFNRYTLTQPLIVNAGKVFVQVTEQNSTSGEAGALADNTTIAMDSATTPKLNANWYFDGSGWFHVFEQGDGGYYNGLNRNWVIRLVLEVPDQAITVTSITPNSSLTNVATSVVITGTQFELGAKAFLGTHELAISNLTAQTIGAAVPVGLPTGFYDVRVRNLSGVEGTLPNGYQILAADGGSGAGGGGGGGTGGGAAGGAGGGTGGGSTGTEALALTAVTPAQTYAGDASSLFLTGGGFRDGARLLIGGTRVDGAVVESSGVISATLTASLLTPGTYDVSVINLNGEQATLAQAFKVLPGSKVQPGCACSQVEFFPLLLATLALLRRRR